MDETMKNAEDTSVELRAIIEAKVSRDPRFYAMQVSGFWMKTSRSDASDETSIWLEGTRYKHPSVSDFKLRLLFRKGAKTKTPRLNPDQTGAGLDTIEINHSFAYLPLLMTQLAQPMRFVVIDQIGTSTARSDIYSYPV